MIVTCREHSARCEAAGSEALEEAPPPGEGPLWLEGLTEGQWRRHRVIRPRRDAVHFTAALGEGIATREQGGVEERRARGASEVEIGFASGTVRGESRGLAMDAV